MNRTAKLLTMNFVLYLVAAVIAGYLVYSHYMLLNGEAGFHSFCSLSQSVDCDVVNASRYSEFLGIPLATWALGWYLTALVLCLVGARSVYARRDALLLLVPLGAVSTLVSAITLVVMLTRLHTLCLMCASLDVLNVATFVLSVAAWRALELPGGLLAQWRQAQRGRIVTFSVTGAVLFLLAHIITAQMVQPVPFDKAQFLTEFRAQPVVTVDPGDAPRLGFQGPNPPVQIVEFADYQCPMCGKAAQKMHRLLQTYGDRMQLAFRNFPLDMACNPRITRPIHQHACEAAKAAICAHRQGKFEAMFEKLFSNQQELGRENILKWGSELGLDSGALSTCMGSSEANLTIQKDIDLAVTLGVESTPTYFFNGRRVEGAVDEPQLRAILRELGKL